jgi:hypothetical protein
MHVRLTGTLCVKYELRHSYLTDVNMREVHSMLHGRVIHASNMHEGRYELVEPDRECPKKWDTQLGHSVLSRVVVHSL